MWTWTCSADGEVFTGATKAEAEGKFYTHCQTEHSKATVVSVNTARDND